MKLRIKGNSLRIRLTKAEVATLAGTGYLEEQTLFPEKKLVYALQKTDRGDGLSATFDANKITMFVPNELIKDWPGNNIVGFDADIQVSAIDTLHLLLEKDFACIDDAVENQDEYYENPNKTC